MIFRIAALSSALLLTVAAHADGNFERTLSVSSQADLYVSSGSGNIRIHPGSDSEIHIKAHLKGNNGWSMGGDGASVEDRIRHIVDNPPIRQSGSEVHVGEVSPEDRKLYNNISIDYEITTPKASALNVHSGSGDVEIDNVGRYLKADTGSGNVRAHGIAGPSDLRTGSGDIELQQQAAGEVKAGTGSGNVRISGLSGGLDAHTGSGDIDANGSLTGPGILRTGSGNVRLHIGSQARFNLDAATGSGSIRVSQPGAPQGRDDRHHVSAAINGGGPTLQVHTGSGDIEVN
jgi:hypothetical protein